MSLIFFESLLGLVLLLVRCYFFQIKRKRRKLDKVQALENYGKADVVEDETDSEYGV